MRFSRPNIIEQTHLHYIVSNVSALSFSGAGQWEEEGGVTQYLYYNGSGDHFTVAWSDEALVGLAFSHESERSEYGLDDEEREPTRWLEEAPEPVRELGERASDWVERLATSALWNHAGETRMSDSMQRPWAHGIKMMEGLGLSPREALFGDSLMQNWSELFSLSERHCEVALELHARVTGTDDEDVTVSDEQEQVLLESQSSFNEVTVEAAEAFAESLEKLDISWQVPRERLEGSP